MFRQACEVCTYGVSSVIVSFAEAAILRIEPWVSAAVEQEFVDSSAERSTRIPDLSKMTRIAMEYVKPSHSKFHSSKSKYVFEVKCLEICQLKVLTVESPCQITDALICIWHNEMQGFYLTLGTTTYSIWEEILRFFHPRMEVQGFSFIQRLFRWSFLRFTTREWILQFCLPDNSSTLSLFINLSILHCLSGRRSQRSHTVMGILEKSWNLEIFQAWKCHGKHTNTKGFEKVSKSTTYNSIESR